MKYLLLGPCAMGIFSMLGALKTIESQLELVEEIAGSSAGSLIGFLLILGKTIDEIFEILIDIDIASLTKPNLLNIITQFGFVGHEEFNKIITKYWNSTFLELFKKTNKKFHVTSYCVNKSSTEYFSVDSHPDMNISDAICMSISVPFIFSAFKYKEFHYIDGGTLEEIPGLAFLNKKQDDILAIKVYNNYTHYEEINKIKTFVELLLNQVLNNRIEYKFKHTININLENVNIFNFSMSHEEKIKLFLNYR
jgi:NTE family protein